MLRGAGLPPHRVAVELIESPLADEGKLAAAMEYYRELGCVIVLDDFGAGYSNFDRIWRLKPDIVKIDREMTRRVTVEPLARRMFTGIVSVLHEAGALVCVEGIETEAEALCATDANADLVQGQYFAGPATQLPGEDVCRETFQRLFADFRAEAIAGPGAPPHHAGAVLPGAVAGGAQPGARREPGRGGHAAARAALRAALLPHPQRRLAAGRQPGIRARMRRRATCGSSRCCPPPAPTGRTSRTFAAPWAPRERFR